VNSQLGRVLVAPLHTEKALNYIEFYNTLLFIVDRKATKHQIKEEFEKTFGVKVEKVRTMITPKGEKLSLIHI
jgi:large subunit ribosomal protein L23